MNQAELDDHKEKVTALDEATVSTIQAYASIHVNWAKKLVDKAFYSKVSEEFPGMTIVKGQYENFDSTFPCDSRLCWRIQPRNR